MGLLTTVAELKEKHSDQKHLRYPGESDVKIKWEGSQEKLDYRVMENGSNLSGGEDS